MLKVLSNILCDLDPKVKVIGQKAGICDGVPSTSALVCFVLLFTSQVNSYGHGRMVSSPNHTFSWASLNKQLTSTLCTYFRL